jgi:signal transduction histidine kinase
MLLQCDWHGQVLWMSDNTRSVLGNLENLAGAFQDPDGSPYTGPSRFSWLFSRIYAAKEGVLLCVQRLEANGAQKPEQERELARLQEALKGNYLRLRSAEESLVARGAAPRRGAGRRMIQQLELERQRLGRELHTGVGQTLAAVRLQVELASANLTDPPAPARQALERAAALAGQAAEQVRSVSQRLHPPEWQRLKMAEALEQLWTAGGIPQRFAAELRIAPLTREPDLEAKAVLYRGAQEGVSNLMRHSGASRVAMSLEEKGADLVLTIWDNGVGFNVAKTLAAPASIEAGLGLRSIREEAVALGGGTSISSGADGTTLTISVPSSPEP